MEKKINLLTDMVNNSPSPMAVYLGEQLIIESANPAMAASWGQKGDVIGKKFFDVISELQRSQLYGQVLKAYQSGIPHHAKDSRIEVKLNGGTMAHYYDYSFIPLFDKQGGIYGVLSTGLDVTELHHARHELRISNERLRMAIDAAGMGTYEIDLETKRIKTSANFDAIWSVGELEKDALTNDMLISRMHPDDLIVRDTAFAEGQKTGLINYQVRIKGSEGYSWIRVNATIIRDEASRPGTIIGITQDIQKDMEFSNEMEKQVASKTTDLKRSNEDLLHFAHVVSHDLKEPVRKIQYFNSLLCGQPEVASSPKALKYAERIDHSAVRMQNIIDGILSYSTLDNSRQKMGKVNLNKIMENIRTDLELIIEDKQALITIGDLPEIEGASILIHQLFYNLLQNSLKFSKAGERPKIDITAQHAQNEGCVMIKVTDNGIGIDRQYCEKIFSPFERLNSKSSYEGNGLGLSLCKKICNRHSGSIKADGELGKGTSFTVVLPLQQSAALI